MGVRIIYCKIMKETKSFSQLLVKENQKSIDNSSTTTVVFLLDQYILLTSKDN